MADEKVDRKRKFRKQFYGEKKKRKFDLLKPGDKGFIVTCANGNERKAIREAYDLLTDYADNVYGITNNPAKGENSTDSSSDTEEEDIELALKAECCEIKNDNKDTLVSDKPGEIRPPKRHHSHFSHFKSVDCKVKNCCFIKWALDNVHPSHLAYDIMNDCRQTKVVKCRFIQRILPVDVTCKTADKEFFESVKILLENEFSVKSQDEATEHGLTYAVQFKSRHSDVISRDSAIRGVGELLSVINPTVKVDLNNPHKTVLIEILGKTCCLAVVRDFQALHRYNPHEIVKDTQVTAANVASS